MPYLVVLNCSWADEFYIEEYQIVRDRTPPEIDAAIRILCERGGYFGSNQGFKSGDLHPSSFAVNYISDTQAAVLEELLGPTFGVGPLYDLFDIYDEGEIEFSPNYEGYNGDNDL